MKRIHPFLLPFLCLGAVASLGATTTYLRFGECYSDPIIANKDGKFYFNVEYCNTVAFSIDVTVRNTDGDEWNTILAFSAFSGEGTCPLTTLTVPKKYMKPIETTFSYFLKNIYGTQFGTWTVVVTPGYAFNAKIVKSDTNLQTSYCIARTGEGARPVTYHFQGITYNREATTRKVGLKDMLIGISRLGSSTPPELFNSDMVFEVRPLNHLNDFPAGEQHVGYRSFPISIYHHVTDGGTAFYKVRLAKRFYFSTRDLTMSETQRDSLDLIADDIYFPIGRGKNTDLWQVSIALCNVGPGKDSFSLARVVQFSQNDFGSKGNSRYTLDWSVS